MLLSIDWDWITGDCADGSHGCCGWCTPPQRKLTRGSSKLIAKGWLTRLEMIRKVTPIYQVGNLWVAECHADILRMVRPDEGMEIIHLDSHLDDADFCGLSCGSWRTFLPKGTTSRWASGQEAVKEHFHDVFICQSSPWTPPSLDHMFWGLVGHFSKIMGVDPEFIGHRRMALMRTWQQIVRKENPEIESNLAQSH
jgi:hypothetical protein